MASSFKKHNSVIGATAGATLKVKDAFGVETEDTIQVRGLDSPEFQSAARRHRAAILAYVEKNGADSRTTEGYLDFVQAETDKLKAAAVISWSFEEPCNITNVLACFKECPFIAEQVDQFAGTRGKFVSASPKI